MKEELFNMLDGELPDEGVAELLHRLSVDPEKRALFLQQLRLQHALAHNGTQASMSTVEAVEMRDRIAAAIGAGGDVAPRSRFRGRVLGALASGLIIGSGLGVLVGYITDRDAQPPAAQTPAPQVPAPQTSRQSAPMATLPVDTSAGADSASARATDSVAKASSASTRSGRKATVRSKTRKPSYGDDLTGAPEAREIAKKKKRSSRSTPE